MKKLVIPVSFSDLTYTKQGIASLMFPLGIAYVASYAQKFLEIDAEIFKYPDDFVAYLEKTTPKIACFSSYSWNNNIAHDFAERIKRKNPNVITVFGGPNYPLQDEEQKEYLSSYPAIDFYVQKEGERAFVELFKLLSENGFDAEKVKRKEIPVPSSHYIYKGNLIKGELLPRLGNLDDIPSPYLSGLCDKFFDGVLIPMFQTTRGCPFSCSYCQDGNKYFNRVTRFSSERVKEEFEYVARRVSVPNTNIVDDNFGMYKEDITTAKAIAELREKYGWPKYIDVATGKNNPERVFECVDILGGQMLLTASVQSTDPAVLKNIRRSNISLEAMLKLTKSGERFKINSLGEIILGLPGDSKRAHFKSITDMIDLGVNQIRSYQLVLLPGSELSEKENRRKFGMETRFRVMPLCFGNYRIYGEKFTSSELDEICVSNNTLSYEDYLECRAFNLTIEIAYNSGIFRELINFLKIHNIPASNFIVNVHNAITKNMGEVYREFLRENEGSIWRDKDELKRFLQRPENVTRGDSSEELRANELYKYRAVIFFTKIKDLHDIVFKEARRLLNRPGECEDYLKELYEFSLARKEDLLADKRERRTFHFDFVNLIRNNFNENPFDEFKPNGIEIEIAHTDEQKKLIVKYVEQYGNTIDGLGRILHKNFVNTLYRDVRVV